MRTVPILGVSFSKIDLKRAVKKIRSWVEKGGRYQVMTLNPEYLVRIQEDQPLKQVVDRADLVVADGTGIILTSWLIYLKNVIPAKAGIYRDYLHRLLGKASTVSLSTLSWLRLPSSRAQAEGSSAECPRPKGSAESPGVTRKSKKKLPLTLSFKNRITGGELVEALAKLAAQEGWKIGLIGGEEGVADKALTQLRLRGFADRGPKNVRRQTKEEWRRIKQLLLQERPQILLTSFGFYGPIWIEKTLKVLQSRGKSLVAMEVGGVFNYLADFSPRPPKILRKIGLEWLWRLVTEPWRIKRQLKLIRFVWMVIKEG